MLSTYAEKNLAKILSYGAAFTSILVISSSVTDPVNAPKLALLGLVGAAAIGIVIASPQVFYSSSARAVFLLSSLFLLAAISASLNSSSPFTQNLYGVYGRNNGLVAYLFLAFILIAAALLVLPTSFETIVKGLLFAGGINVIYCGWVLAFGDFIGWENPYGNILGTFGNPNFIGAFLGIFLSAYVAYAIGPNRPKIWKWSLFVVVPLSLFEIIESHAIQGRVLAAGGLALVTFSYLRFNINRLLLSAFSIFATIVGLLAVLGALQIGPLTQYIYKTSVSLRGQYWLAGWNAGETKPLTGLGMDSLGDWYRRVRDPQAITLPGVDTVVNAAHNVYMDMFAFGGWPLLLTYSALVGYSAYAMVFTFLHQKSYDGTFTALAVAWVCYQIQSIISINQIGLAIWGWLLGGTVIAYYRVARRNDLKQASIESKSKRKRIDSGLRTLKVGDYRVIISSFVTGLIGLIIALPPYTSDAKWKAAISSANLSQIEDSMKSSYFNPQNTTRYLSNIRLLEENKLGDVAHKYTLQAIEWNPEVYDFWRALYFLSKSSTADREKAVINMKLLDPLNPDVTAKS